MENKVNLLMQHLKSCSNLINKGYVNVQICGLDWLNKFCEEFLQFANNLHLYINNGIDKRSVSTNEHLETIFLCLIQIVIAVKHMERIIKAEQQAGRRSVLSASRQHFLDRIVWCMERLIDSLRMLANIGERTGSPTRPLEENNYVQLMDIVFDYLSPFSTYCENAINSKRNMAEKNAEIMFKSKQVRYIVDLILGHTLAFANVALKQDKKALSALCQKVLRECSEFQHECDFNQVDFKGNESNRKLKAMSLENALYQLEDYLNEALLRLVYHCFLDFDKFSVQKLRSVLSSANAENESAVDEIIADFDVNTDRATQIGIFAIAFAPNVKMKTIIRSCLASLESLDSCLVPSLQTQHIGDLHSEILEQHFNEEVNIFKQALQEIIDSTAFVSCYLDILNDCIVAIDQKFDKFRLQDMSQMGECLNAHFQLNTNQKVLSTDRRKYFDQFQSILRECQAILKCADQVDAKRIVKRFKIMRSILRKLYNELTDGEQHKLKSESVFIMSDELSENQRIFESCGIVPSMSSILYSNQTAKLRRGKKRIVSGSMLGNYSKLSTVETIMSRTSTVAKKQLLNADESNTLPKTELRCSVRRKESLRTAMFKRQNVAESEKLYDMYKSQASSLQITDIIDELSNLSTICSAASRIELIASV